MRYLTKPHPIFGSFAAAAISLLPVLAMAVVEINAVPSGVVDAGQNDDAGLRGAGLALAAAPFVYIIAVPVCYTVGMLLVSLGLRRLSGFLAGTVAIALILAIFAGLLIAAPSHFGVNDVDQLNPQPKAGLRKQSPSVLAHSNPKDRERQNIASGEGHVKCTADCVAHTAKLGPSPA